MLYRELAVKASLHSSSRLLKKLHYYEQFVNAYPEGWVYFQERCAEVRQINHMEVG